MGGGKSKSSSSTTEQGTSTTYGAGTEFGQSLIPQAGNLATQNAGTQAFSGDRVAAAPDLGSGNYSAQYGATPSTIVATRTTADAPTVTHVDKNYQPGIQAGLAGANANIPALSNISQQGLTNVQQMLAGPENSYVQQIMASLQTEHNKAAARSQNAIAATAGSQGAYGGTDMARQQAWTAGEQQNALDSTTANVLYDNYNRWVQQVNAAPGVAAGYADVGTYGADQLLEYGGLQQENLRDQQAATDFNQWNQGTLTDTNAQLSADEAMAQWQAAYTSDQARVADLQGRTAAQTDVAQAGMDNAYLNWLSQQEQLEAKIGNLNALGGFAAGLPGSTTESKGTSNSTSTSSGGGNGLGSLGGLLGAGMQAFGGNGSGGGFFSGGKAATGGTKK